MYTTLIFIVSPIVRILEKSLILNSLHVYIFILFNFSENL